MTELLSQTAITAVAVSIFTIICARWFLKLGRPGSTALDNVPHSLASTGPFWFVSDQIKYFKHGFRLIEEAYFKHPEGIFLAPDKEVYVLPVRYLDELKSKPTSVASLTHAVVDYFLGPYTYLDIDLYSNAAIWGLLHGRLGRQVGDLVPIFDEECRYSLRKELPDSAEWTSVTLYGAVQRIIARMNARIYVGESLCRDETWLTTSIDYSTCVFVGVGYLKPFPKFLQPLAAWFIPYFRRIKEHQNRAAKTLLPDLTHRQQAMADREAGRSSTAADDLPDDLTQWLLNEPTERHMTSERLAALQLLSCFASIDGTANHITNVILDVAARWETYVPTLREEVKTICLDGGRHNEMKVTKQHLNDLSRLDSFMKESQRLNPLGALSFKRKVLAPITLSDGVYLPPGIVIAMPSAAMAKDPRYHENPRIFDGMRFHRCRTASQSSNTEPSQDASARDEPAVASSSHQFTTTGPGSLTFGHGRYACAGRFFASAESKIVLSHLLWNYDIRLVGTDGLSPDQISAMRPPNLLLGDSNITDYNLKVEVRKRISRSL